MEHHLLQKEIVSGIWSKDLKRYIAESGYHFTDQELLGIAYHFAPTFEERLRLLQLLADYAPSVSDHASKCVAWQKKCLQWFCKPEANELYELCIRQNSDDSGDTVLCASYDVALQQIDEYYKAYDFEQETQQTRYVIRKRKLQQSGQAYDEDIPRECVLAAGKVLLSVDGPCGETENGECSHSCMGCKASCIKDQEVCFPTFITDCSAVKYRLPDGSIHYGVCLNEDDQPREFEFIIPLNSPMMQNRSYDKDMDWVWHEHIPGPEVEIVDPQALPEEWKENYYAFIEYQSK